MKITFKPVKKSEKQRYTLGIIYEPNVKDAHGDFASAEVIRQAAWNFARELQGKEGIFKGTRKLAQDIARVIKSGTGQDIAVETDDPMLQVIGHVVAAANGIEQPPLDEDIFDRVSKMVDDDSPLGDQHEVWNSDFGDIVDFFTAPVDMEIGGEVVTKDSWLMGVVWSEEMFRKIERGERTGYSLGAFVVATEVEDDA